MVEKSYKGRIISAVIALCTALSVPLSVRAQNEQTDSLVRLMNADYIEQYEVDEGLVRKAINATFLHNGTYLICDTSTWVLDSSVINCVGNVRLIQGETELTSDKLDYYIDLDLAQFRGTLVQLRNQQDNILRTRHLDYNTRDSVATFLNGAAMRSSEGQLIESDRGWYYNAAEYFDFRDNVNMYTDSVFIKTESLRYNSAVDVAHFTSPINFWKDDDNMLSAESGWYDRPRELFFFKDKVHALTRDQESWSDSLYFYRTANNIELRGRAQVQDTTRSVAALSEYIFYEDSLARVTMHTDAAVALWSETDGKIDTTYFGADTLVYRSIRMCDIPQTEIDVAATRRTEILSDPVTEYRKRAAEEAAADKKREQDEAAAARPGGRSPAAARNAAPAARGEAPAVEEKPVAAPSDTTAADSLPFPRDSLMLQRDSLAVGVDSLSIGLDSLGVQLDSLGAQVDSVAAPLDTTKIAFLTGLGNVRVFREDLRLRADSVEFSQLDSIARFYNDPVIWNGETHQYTSDSLYVLVKENAVDRACLMSNAFIAVMEDSTHFDQIRGSDVLAYFNDDTSLRRFDALGGVNAIFFLREEEVLATVNKVESTMLSATFVDGDVERIFYFQSPKNDAYPTAQLAPADRELKGLNWRPAERPASPEDITPLKLRPSERRFYESLDRPPFVQTRLYFSGYMDELYRSLEEAQRRKQARDAARQQADAAAFAEAAPADTLPSPAADSLTVVRDSLVSVSLDSLLLAPADSTMRAATDSLSSGDDDYMSDRELRRALRIARRDARWAELDARDAQKAADKAARIETRRLRKEARAEARMQARAEKEKRKLIKYMEQFEKQKNKHERTQEPEPSGERPQGVEAGGELQAADPGQ